MWVQCGSSADAWHRAVSRDSSCYKEELSAVFSLGGIHMPTGSRGRIRACEGLLPSPSLCVMLTLSCI